MKVREGKRKRNIVYGRKGKKLREIKGSGILSQGRKLRKGTRNKEKEGREEGILANSARGRKIKGR